VSLLIFAAPVWIGSHIGIAGTRVRDAIALRIGEGPFRGLFLLLSILAIVFLVLTWIGTLIAIRTERLSLPVAIRAGLAERGTGSTRSRHTACT
jgi:NnrU protein